MLPTFSLCTVSQRAHYSIDQGTTEDIVADDNITNVNVTLEESIAAEATPEKPSRWQVIYFKSEFKVPQHRLNGLATIEDATDLDSKL